MTPWSSRKMNLTYKVIKLLKRKTKRLKHLSQRFLTILTWIKLTAMKMLYLRKSLPMRKKKASKSKVCHRYRSWQNLKENSKNVNLKSTKTSKFLSKYSTQKLINLLKHPKTSESWWKRDMQRSKRNSKGKKRKTKERWKGSFRKSGAKC